MDWHQRMNRAMEYIESQLSGDIDPAVAARLAECSLWEFQRLFSLTAHVTLGEYIRLRRMTLAADEIRSRGGKIIDVALKYGYESPAAFSRAFSQWHGMAPSSARNGDAALKAFSKITFPLTESGRLDKMGKFSERGYVVRENAPVYFTRDMDRTVKWFEDVLGWFGDIVSRRQDGTGEYGCVFDYPAEVAVAHITPFRGFHLFLGEPVQGVAGFMMVEGLDALHKLVVDSGWEQISSIEAQSWGSRECRLTTIDGCVIRFFETGQ